jgi:small GTP-binding protein
MPANLTPQYYEAEKRYRAAREPEDKLAALEEMLAIMPKHKGTDHLKADLRRKIAKLLQEGDRKQATQHASEVIPKEGAGQVVIIGLPNAGKSKLVASLTNAIPAVADYPFTTHSTTPGMMEFENIQIQLVDTPPLTPQHIEPWLPNTIRRADALIVVVDLSDNPEGQLEAVIAQLESKRINLNDRLALVVANKLDAAGAEASFETLKRKYSETVNLVAVSALDGRGLEDLRRAIYDTLAIIRVYTKTPGGKPDYTDPIVLDRGSTLEDAAASVHKDFARKLKYARVWGSGKHDGIMVKRDHILQDGDVIELHM